LLKSASKEIPMKITRAFSARPNTFCKAFALFLCGAGILGCGTEDDPGTIDVLVSSADGGSRVVSPPRPAPVTKCRDGQRITILPKLPEGGGTNIVVWPDPGPCATTDAAADDGMADGQASGVSD
jgi:hypothetical protein